MPKSESDYLKTIKDIYLSNDIDTFCHKVINFARSNNFDPYVESEGPIERIFTLSINYLDDDRTEADKASIRSEIDSIIKTL